MSLISHLTSSKHTLTLAVAARDKAYTTHSFQMSPGTKEATGGGETTGERMLASSRQGSGTEFSSEQRCGKKRQLKRKGQDADPITFNPLLSSLSVFTTYLAIK